MKKENLKLDLILARSPRVGSSWSPRSGSQNLETENYFISGEKSLIMCSGQARIESVPERIH